MVSTEAAFRDADAAGGEQRRRRRSNLLVAGMVLALVCVGALGWWWRHPGMFGAQGSAVGMYSPAGTTAWLGVAQPLRKLGSGTVTIHSAEPRVIEGNATIEVVTCRTSGSKGGVGAARGPLRGNCEELMKAEGSTLRVDDQLLLRVHSDEPGRVIVRGVDILYSSGWQRGSQITGQTVRVRFGTQTVREHLRRR